MGLTLQFLQVRRVQRTLSVAVGAMGGPDACVHGHMADSVAAADTIKSHLRSSGTTRWCREQRSVKPSAQPTLVRTQHLPHNTCHHLRKRPARCGNAARRAVSFLSRRVSSCAAVGHRVAIVTDIWRTASGPKERSAEPLALPIRARFVPLRGHPDCSSGWCMPCIPGGRFSAVLLSRAAGWSCSFLRRGRLKDRPAPCHRGCRGRRRPSARRLPPVEDWRGAVASDAARGSGRARAAASCRKRGSRCPVSGTGSG